MWQRNRHYNQRLISTEEVWLNAFGTMSYQNGGYPPQQPEYSPQQHGYPPQQPGYHHNIQDFHNKHWRTLLKQRQPIKIPAIQTITMDTHKKWTLEIWMALPQFVSLWLFRWEWYLMFGKTELPVRYKLEFTKKNKPKQFNFNFSILMLESNFEL